MNGSLSQNAVGTITGLTVVISVAHGTELSSLVPSFTHTGAAIYVGTTEQTSGLSYQDFTETVVYTVKAADGTSQYYSVTVTPEPQIFTEDAPLIYKFMERPVAVNNNGLSTLQTHRYHIRGPSIYNADKTVSYPLVIALHAWGLPNSETPSGYWQDGSPICGIYANGVPPIFEYSPMCPPPYYTDAEPSAPKGGEWNSPAMLQMFVDTLKDLVHRYNIDKKRIYIIGFSMGGAGSWYLAQKWYDETGIPIAAIVPNAGYSPSKAMLEEGQFPDLYRSAIWYHVGEDDNLGDNFELAKFTYERLKTQGGPGTEYTEIRTEGDGLHIPGAEDPREPLVSNFKEFVINGQSRYRLSIYLDRNHEDLSTRNTDYVSWLFDQSIE